MVSDGDAAILEAAAKLLDGAAAYFWQVNLKVAEMKGLGGKSLVGFRTIQLPPPLT
jgi:hypothetical protein